jgi:heme-degrading monooxygenase HmoA
MIEIRVFGLRDEVAEADFLAADQRVQAEFSPFQPGFVRRTTARGANPQSWLVLTLWSSAEALDQALTAAATDPAASALDALIDPATERIARFEEIGG